MRGRAIAVGICAWMLAAAVTFAQPAPNFSLTPSPLAFGSVCVGTVADARPVAVRNLAQSGSGQEIVVTSINRSGSTDFTRSALQPSGPLAPQATATFGVTFAPSIRGNRTARFTVTAEDADNSQQTSTEHVDVFGSGVDRRIGADSSTVAFGDQRVATRSPTKSLVVRNPGLDPLTITSVGRGGTNARDFRLSAPAVPFTIGAGDFRTINVSFQPAGDGLRRGSVVIGSNACTQPRLTVPLVGTGVEPNVVLDPNPINVGTSPVDKESRATAVTLRNGGGAVLRITAIQVVGGDAADFALSGLPPMPARVQPDDEFVFQVRMTASEEGQRLANINVLSDDPDAATTTVAVRGFGSAASPSPSPSVTASPSPTRRPSPTEEPRALAGAPNDALAIFLVIGGVLAAFVGLLFVRRFLRRPED